MPTSAAKSTSAPAPATTRRVFVTGPWFAAAIGFLCYANSLTNQFSYDDRSMIVENPRVRDLSDVRAIWLTDWWLTDTEVAGVVEPGRDRLYRPLTLFSFALNHAVHGLTPLGFHLVNVLLHAAVCVLVYRFAMQLTQQREIAAIAAILFAVHPVHAEAVASVVGRAEVLAAFFLLGGLLLLFRGVDWPSGWQSAAAAVLFFLALLAKETAICYPALAALTLMWRRGALASVRERRFWTSLAIIAVPLVAYFPMRYISLEHTLFRARAVGLLLNPITDAEGLARVWGALQILGEYGRLLVAPAHLSADYGKAVIDPNDAMDVMVFIGAITLGVIVAVLVRSLTDPRWRLAGFLTGMFVLSYALISNTVLVIGVSVAERLMYWPSVPVCILLAVAVSAVADRLSRSATAASSQRLIRLGGIALLVAMGLRTVVRNPDWYDNNSIFTADAQTTPRSVQINNGYAAVLVMQYAREPNRALRDEKLAIAERHARWALELAPRWPDGMATLGTIRGLQGDLPEGIRWLEAALQIHPYKAHWRERLAQFRAMLPGSVDVDALRARVLAAPQDGPAHRELGDALLQQGDYIGAVAALEAARRLAPGDAGTLALLGQALTLIHREDEAAAILLEAVRIDDSDWASHANLARLLAPTQPAAALRHAQRAYELKPGTVETTMNLAEALAANGDKPAAIKLLGDLIRAMPADEPRRPVVQDRLRELQGP